MDQVLQDCPHPIRHALAGQRTIQPHCRMAAATAAVSRATRVALPTRHHFTWKGAEYTDVSPVTVKLRL